MSEDDEGQAGTQATIVEAKLTTTTIPPTRSTTTVKVVNTTEETTTVVNEATDPTAKPKPRLINLSVDELQNFANALHNQTNQRGPKKNIGDLSDVNMDADDDDEPPKLSNHEHKPKISDKFYSNLQVPFSPLMTIDKSEEIETCKENEITYKVCKLCITRSVTQSILNILILLQTSCYDNKSQNKICVRVVLKLKNK